MMPIVPPVAHFGAIKAAAAERRLIEWLRSAHATVPERAISLGDMKRLPRRVLSRLAKAGAVREAREGRWYLDEPMYAEHRDRRRRAAMIAVFAGVLAALVVFLLSRQ